jgi:hypothetical protein
MSFATQTETLEQEVNRRVNQFIADNPRFAGDFLILQTVALIGVSAALGMMDRAEPDPEVELFHSEQEQLDEQRFFIQHPSGRVE